MTTSLCWCGHPRSDHIYSTGDCDECDRCEIFKAVEGLPTVTLSPIPAGWTLDVYDGSLHLATFVEGEQKFYSWHVRVHNGHIRIIADDFNYASREAAHAGMLSWLTSHDWDINDPRCEVQP